jgi:iron complex transport system ATP-binding protein
MTGLDLHDLTASYNGTQVLRGVSLHVPARAWVALVGPNGAGKSTLLRAVAALVPHAGSIMIGGRLTSQMTRRELSRLVAFSPQRPVLPEGVTVADYVAIGRTPYVPYLGTETSHDHDVVTGVLRRLELEDLSGRRVDALSGGEAQRVVLARALAQQSEILLLDEPTSALDVGHQQQVMELIDQLRVEDGLTVLSALHDLTLAGQYADRLVMMNRGVVVSDGSARQVLTEEHIMEHYDARVRVVDSRDEGLTVTPLRPTRPTTGSTRP